VAFAFVAGVSPLVGLQTAFVVCLVTALCGGRPAMISGAAGSLAVVSVHLVSQHGVEYLFPTVVLMGIWQIIAGLWKLGEHIDLVPEPVIHGFLNGLAIIIFTAQLQHFNNLSGVAFYIMLGLVLFTMFVTHMLPKITKAIPAGLTAIFLVSTVMVVFKLPTKTVGDVAPVGGTLPVFHIPTIPWTLETLKIILPYSILLALIGLMETLLTQTLVDDVTQTPSKPNLECFGQGLANVITGMFGGMGGCAMIGQTVINLSSGGRSRISGVVCALAMLCYILFASKFIEMIPLASLVGIMFVVCAMTFKWSSIQNLSRVPWIDTLLILVVSISTIVFNLAIAVMIGLVIYATHKYCEKKGWL
jgi:SulP family sulfate permease